MTSNSLLKRLLGEGTPGMAPGTQPPPQSNQEPPQEPRPPHEDEPPQDEPMHTQEVTDEPPANMAPAPTTQELIQQWQSGDHMAVAARLMFTEASYADFVDLCFAIGQEAGRELGHLLDELADTEGMEPPETPPEYQQALASVGGEEEGVV